MFELEKSIADWRRQMNAAGIKAPVPLDELENHLREEVDHQTRAGADIQSAFSRAVERMGEADTLKKEFARVQRLKTVRTRESLRRWSVAVGTGFVYCVLFPTWYLGVRSGKMEITWLEVVFALGAMAPMILFGWAGRSFAKHLPITSERTILVVAFAGIFLGAAALRLIWSVLTIDNLAHVQIALLWSLSPLLGVGNCFSAWSDRSARMRPGQS
jgi:hypothetical protein